MCDIIRDPSSQRFPATFVIATVLPGRTSHCRYLTPDTSEVGEIQVNEHPKLLPGRSVAYRVLMSSRSMRCCRPTPMRMDDA